MTPRRRAALLGLALVCAGLLAAGSQLLVGLARLQNAWAGQPGAPVVCSFRARTGVPCLGCGGTRALELAARGRVLESLRLNAVGAWAGLGLWTGVAIGLLAAAGRAPRWRAVFVTLATTGVLAFVVQFFSWWRRFGPTLS